MSFRAIARTLGRSVSTISEEVKRGSVSQRLSNGKELYKYFADVGERAYEKNRKDSHARGMEKYLDELTEALTAKIRVHSVDR